MRNLFSILLLVIFLSGCASNPQTSHSKPNRVESKHSHIISKYDLDTHSHRCLFAPAYTSHNQVEQISKLLNQKDAKILNYKIENKIQEIYNRAHLISSRYKIIEKSKVTHLKHLSNMISQNHDSVFDSLESKVNIAKALDHFARIDDLVADVPIFIPVKNALISSKFGMRKLKGKRKRMHKGLDLVGVKNARIYAAANGKVLEVAYSASYGNYVLIQHKKNLKTRYAHLKTLKVNSGQKVRQGQVIGIQGSTGRSNRDHLHFEVIHRKRHLNPINFVGREVGCHRT